jgi:hypothetical protein
MYNSKDIQFVGKHDFDKESAKSSAEWNGKTFSVNIFKWELKANGKSMKPSKGLVRVISTPKLFNYTILVCENVVKDLDSGLWDGRKTVKIKSHV